MTREKDKQAMSEGRGPVAGSGRSGGGDSGGGAYPNPHSGRKPDKGGFMGHGGQTEMEYHGQGQLGEQVLEGNENAPAAKAGSGQDKDDDSGKA